MIPPGIEVGTRIAVVGTSGAGKSFVAEALAAKLGLRYICNDAIIWRPNWQAVPDDEVFVAIDELTAGDDWTFDGNLGPKPSDMLVLGRCDTLVWLDLPRWQVHGQVIRRTLHRVITGKPLWHGNVETWRGLVARDSIVWWSIKTFDRRRRTYGAFFADPALADKRRIRLTSRAQVTSWLAAIGQPVGSPWP